MKTLPKAKITFIKTEKPDGTTSVKIEKKIKLIVTKKNGKLNFKKKEE